MKRPAPRPRPGPDRDDDAPARDRRPCPACGTPMAERDDFFRSRELPALDEVRVLLCRRCGRIGADVAGIEVRWRSVGEPGVRDALYADAVEGLRQLRFLVAEPGDPIFRPLR